MTEKAKVRKSKTSVVFEEKPQKSDNLGEMETLRQELAQLKGKLKPASQKPVVDDEEDDDDAVQREYERPIVYAKPKRERSQKQIEQFQKAVEARKASIAKRAEMRKEAEDKAQKLLEEKILKKAIRVKKKQIKQLEVFEPTESEEEAEEEAEEEIARPAPPRPKQEVKPRPAPVQAPKMKYSFI